MNNTVQNTRSVQKILQYTYGIVPIVAGLDKFTNLLTRMLPFSAGTFMQIVGIIEIVAGILVLVRPRTGGYLVMAWLTLIALSLIFGGHYFDMAVRDLVMAVGAYCFVKLSAINSNQNSPQYSKS